jgi:Glycosyl transferase family 2
MAIKVRDEGDVIEDNLRYHHALGVEHFIVTDDRSTDATVDVLDRYAAAGLATVHRPETESYMEEAAGWMQGMARLASEEHGADWVIHGDADEFWWPIEGTLPETLARVPGRYGAVSAPRTEFVARPDGPGSFAERMTVREARSSLRPKLAHRAAPDVVVLDRGGHYLASEAELEHGERGPDRAIFRSAEDRVARLRVPEVRFAAAPVWPLRILHFPVRSLAQTARRAEVFLPTATRGPARKRFRERLEAGETEAIFEGLAWSDQEVESAVAEGLLVHDPRLRDLLPRCPDPLAGERPEPGTVSISSDEDEARREREDLEFDAMRLSTKFTNELFLARRRLQRRIA